MPQYNLSGVEVRFPFEAYPCQLDYMSRVIEALQQGQNALLESPTGTGKTLCLLCAALAWRESLINKAEARVGEVQQQQHASQLVQGLREAYAELNAEKVRNSAGGLPVIIYSSRTHSQLQQVMKELRNTDYRPHNALLSSRQQTCLNPGVSSLNGTAANRACRALVASRGCKWHVNVERYLKNNPDTLQEVLDIEEIVKLGQTRTLCPYYMGREMAKSADIVFLPYNYLMDSKFRTGLGINWERAVIIFDEAHNVEGVCSDAVSFDLPAPVLAGCIVELGTAAELALSRADGPDNVVNEFGVKEKGTSYGNAAQQLRQLQMVLQRLENEIASLQVDPQKGLTRPGAFIFELFAKLNLTTETYLLMASLIETALELLTSAAVESGRSSGSRSSSYRLHTLDEALRLAFASAEALEPGAPPPHLGYRVHVHLEKARDGRMLPTLSYWCFSPGQTMAQLAQIKVGSIILTSGTLSPLDSFAAELALPFPVRLENPHVIDPSQVWIGVVPVGPSGHMLNSSFQTRDSKGYKEDLGNAIVNFARIVPDGLLVFFPSYGLLSKCLEAWKQVNIAGNCIWERISKHKACVVEPRDSALFPQAAEDFKSKLSDPSYHGAVFFAVCRGKVSEGLDFSDRAGRAVVITGIPFATKTDPKVCIKQDLLNEQHRAQHKRPYGSEAGAPGLTGQQWYSQQAMRAVNQAMGRVIRHRRDYGAIILCDERFKGEGIRRQLSKWLRDGVVVHPNYGSAASSLTGFFKKQAENARQGLVSDGPVVARGGSNPNWSSSGGGGPFANAVERRDSSRAVQRCAPASAPLAMDVVGLTDLLGCAAAPYASGGSQDSMPGPKEGSSRLMSALGARQAQQPQQVQQQQQAQQQRDSLKNDVDELLAALGAAPSGTAQQAQQQQQKDPLQPSSQQHLKPWDKLGIPSSMLRLYGSRPPPTRASAAPPLPAAHNPTIIGPAHLVQKHQQQQQGAAQATARRSVSPNTAAGSPQGSGGSSAAAGQAAANGGSGATAGSTAPCEPQPTEAPQAAKEPQAVKDYLQQLKSELPAEGYQAVVAALRLYRKDPNKERLVGALVEALKAPERAHLLPALERFLPSEARQGFSETIRPYVNVALRKPAAPAAAPAAAAAAGQAQRSAPAAITSHHARPQALAGSQQGPPALASLQPSSKLLAQQAQPAASRGPPPMQQPGQPGRLHQQQPGVHSAAAAKLFGPTAAMLQQQPRAAAAQGGSRPGAGAGAGAGAARGPIPPGSAVGGQWPGPRQLQQPHRGQPLQQQQQRVVPGGVGPSGAIPPPRQYAAGGVAKPPMAAGTAAGGGGFPPQRSGAAPIRGIPPPQPALPPQQQPQQQRQGSAAGGKGTPTTKLAKCTACGKAPMDAPHVSVCGHAACYACWLKALALMKCPGCKRHVRKAQLTKMYFM